MLLTRISIELVRNLVMPHVLARVAFERDGWQHHATIVKGERTGRVLVTFPGECKPADRETHRRAETQILKAYVRRAGLDLKARGRASA